jgi:hypothetical protein
MFSSSFGRAFQFRVRGIFAVVTMLAFTSGVCHSAGLAATESAIVVCVTAIFFAPAYLRA